MGVAGRMLTVREVATRLQVHEESVRRWLREGQIRGVPLGGRAGWRIPKKSWGGSLRSGAGVPGGQEDQNAERSPVVVDARDGLTTAAQGPAASSGR
jgi:excisionase family DNA binding protein